MVTRKRSLRSGKKRPRSRMGRGDVLITNYIKEWRLFRGFETQRDLSRVCGLPSQTISRLEAHRLAYTPWSLQLLAKALKCHEGDLISRDPSKIDADIFMVYEQMSATDRAKLLKGRS